jgi:hypothetical protein
MIIVRVNKRSANESLTIFLFEIMWVNYRVIKRITRLDVL